MPNIPKAIGNFIIGGGLIIAGHLSGNPLLVHAGASFGLRGFNLLRGNAPGGPDGGVAEEHGIDLQNVTGNVAVPVVYGTTKLGAIIADVRVDTGSDNNEDLYVPTVFCHGSRDNLGIENFGIITFNETTAIIDNGTVQNPFVNVLEASEYLGTATQDVADLTINGTDMDTLFAEWVKTEDKGSGMAGILFYMKFSRSVYPAGLPSIVAVVSGNFVEDTRSTVSGVDITFNENTPAKDTIVRASGSFVDDNWTSGDRLVVSGSGSNDGTYTVDGVAALTITLVTADDLADEGPSGGITLTKWAAPTNGGGDNPALCIRDYLLSTIYGAGVDSSLIDDTSFEAMANFCDETVNVPDGAGGTTTGTRFTCNGVIHTGASLKENLDRLLSSCRGNLIFEGGVYRLFITRSVAASGITLDADNIVGDWRFGEAGSDTKVNTVFATFLDPTMDYQPNVVQWPQGGNVYLTADNSAVRQVEFDLPMTQEVYMAEQIAMVLLKESRFGITAQVTCTEEMLQLQVGDVVTVTHDTPSWTAKKFWVVGLSLLQEEAMVQVALKEYDKVLSGVDVTFNENTPSADTIVRDTGDFEADEWGTGDVVVVAGSSLNDDSYTVDSLSGDTLTLIGTDDLADEASASGVTLTTTAYTHNDQSDAVTLPADDLPRDINDIADPTNLALTATQVEGFFTATGSYTPRIKVTLTDAGDVNVDVYDVEAKRTADANFDNVGRMLFGAAEFFVSPVTEGESWTVRVRSRNEATGVTGNFVSDTVTPDYPAAASTEAIEDGWSGSQNAGSPEDGDEELNDVDQKAYSNLEDANEIVTTYTIFYDVDASLLPANETSTLTFYKNDAAGSTSWTELDSASHDNGDNVTDQTFTFQGSMGLNFDFRVELTYSFVPAGDGEKSSYIMHGEDHGTEAGVQYDKITTQLIGVTVPAEQVTAGTFDAGPYLFPSNTVGGITDLTIVDLVAGAVPASLVTAGSFGTGAYVFDDAVTITGNVLIGTATAASDDPRLDVIESAGRILVGAQTANDMATKAASWGVRHYDNSEESCFIIRGRSSLTENLVSYGGGAGGVFNAATVHEWYTAANNTTFTAGTLAMDLTGVGAASILRLRGNLDVDVALTAASGAFTGAIEAAAGTFRAGTSGVSTSVLTLGPASGNSNAAGSPLGKIEWFNTDSSNDQPGVVARIEALTYLSFGSGGFLVFSTHDGGEGGEGSAPVERWRITGNGSLVANTGILLQTAATASGAAGLNLPHGTAPSSPVDGDRWTTSVAGFDQIDGVTKEIQYRDEGVSTGIVTKTGAYTATATDHTILCDASGGPFTITLPAGIAGTEYHIKKIDSSGSVVTIDGNASETIDDDLTVELTAHNESLMLKSDGSNWHVL